MHFVEQKCINFNKNETKSKIESPQHKLPLIEEPQTRSKTVMSWSS